MEDPKDKTINIEVDRDVADGTYSNMVIISHSSSEFVLDFIRVMPNTPKARIKSRVILTPQHAKRLLNALQDNLQKYEQQFGSIDGTADPQMTAPFKFSGFGGGEA